MRTVFADTFFFLALLDSKERQHMNALAASSDETLQIVTSEWVLTEFADAYADPKDRPDFLAIYRALEKNLRVRIIPASSRLFQQGIDFYSKRLDKKWSLTDCISFVIMHDERIPEALTGDRDFEQAGYTALLK
ncbi:MAG TPA: PIN domain-containing protein [Pirellulaceae bacterium]|jgi:hypothetical protein